MNRILNIFKAAALTVCAAAALVSCTEKEDTVAKAVLGTQSALNFSAKSAEAQVITVYSDGDWHSTVPSWITVDPATGNGVTDVTVSVSDNVDAQGLLEPRSDSLIFSGNTLASRLIVIVSQEGDAYRNAQHLTVDKIAALEDGKTFVLDEAAVVAVSTAGCVVSDGTVNLYAKTATEVKLGDKVSVKGFKGTLNGVPCISQVDELKVLSSGTASYPAPQDITAGIDTYDATSSDYITVSGLVAGGNLKVTVADVEYSVKQVDVPAELSISKLNGNKVDLTGYSVGILGAKMIGIVTTAMKDNGPAVVPRPEKLLYAKWRFTTNLYKNYASFFGGLDPGKVSNDEGTGECYVPSNVEGNGKIEYWQIDKSALGSNKASRIIGASGHPYVTGAWPGDYWLFSATDNYEYPAGTTLHIKYLTRVSKTGHKYWMLEYFDGAEWKPAEEYPVAVETETGSNASYNFIEQTSNVAVECSWTLAVPCKEPKFRMRCVANWQAQGGALASPNGGTCRIADNDDDGEDAGPVFEVLDAPAEGGGDVAGAPELPVAWKVRVADHNYAETWPLDNGFATELGVSGTVNSVVGKGTIWYNNESGNTADLASGKKKTKLDISDNSPRVTGAWPGDYCEFRVPGNVAKGKKVHIKFETRTSATNPKYWRLQYLNGTEFVDACETSTVTVEGTPVVYTHAMNADGATNVQVEATVSYTANTQDIVFHFVCQSAMGAGGDMLSAPNGGTWRLTVTDVESTEWQPQIDWAN